MHAIDRLLLCRIADSTPAKDPGRRQARQSSQNREAAHSPPVTAGLRHGISEEDTVTQLLRKAGCRWWRTFPRKRLLYLAL